MYHTWMRYFTPSPTHHKLGLVCLGVGLQHGTLPTVGPRTLDNHVAVVINAGSGWYRGPDGRRATVTAPALIWLVPGIPHHYGPDPATGWDESFVDFTGPATTTYTELGYHRARPAPSSPSPTPRPPAPAVGASRAPHAAETPSWKSRPAPPSTNSSSPCAAPAPTSEPTGTPCSSPWPATPSSP